MGKALADNFQSAREVFNEVDEALGQAVASLGVWCGGMMMRVQGGQVVVEGRVG